MSKVRDVQRRVEEAGWVYDHTEGDHRQYRHPQLPGKVTIPGHPGDDLASGTEANIYRQAGIRGGRGRKGQ